MSNQKKNVRKNFRDSTFKRDKYKCVMCGLAADLNDPEATLDAHHITNRNLMPNGGYVKENGVSLCKVGKNCHLSAENNVLGFEADVLYKKIGSSYKKALEASEKL